MPTGRTGAEPTVGSRHVGLLFLTVFHLLARSSVNICGRKSALLRGGRKIPFCDVMHRTGLYVRGGNQSVIRLYGNSAVAQ